MSDDDKDKSASGPPPGETPGPEKSARPPSDLPIPVAVSNFFVCRPVPTKSLPAAPDAAVR